MGKIVINKTDTGQKVLLDTTNEGVTGGYFDKQEVWHDFGGGGGGNARTFFINTINNSSESNQPIDVTTLLTTGQYGFTPVRFSPDWTPKNSIRVGESSVNPIITVIGDLSKNEFSGIVLAEGMELEVSGPAELHEVDTNYYLIKPTADGEITIITKTRT